MKKSVGVVLLAAVLTCAVMAEAQKPVAQAKSILLPLSDARAACDVAMSYILYHDSIARIATRDIWSEAPSERVHLFLSAHDSIGREVTPATTIAKLRQRGVNAHPAWTEKKWRLKNTQVSFGSSLLIRLVGMKPDGKHQVQWTATVVILPTNAGREMGQEFTLQSKKLNGSWKVTGCKQTKSRL